LTHVRHFLRLRGQCIKLSYVYGASFANILDETFKKASLIDQSLGLYDEQSVPYRQLSCHVPTLFTLTPSRKDLLEIAPTTLVITSFADREFSVEYIILLSICNLQFTSALQPRLIQPVLSQGNWFSHFYFQL